VNGIWSVGVLVKSAGSVALFRHQTTSKGKFNEKWIRTYSDKVSSYENYVKNPTAMIYEKFRSYIHY